MGILVVRVFGCWDGILNGVAFFFFNLGVRMEENCSIYVMRGIRRLKCRCMERLLLHIQEREIEVAHIRFMLCPAARTPRRKCAVGSLALLFITVVCLDDIKLFLSNGNSN